MKHGWWIFWSLVAAVFCLPLVFACGLFAWVKFDDWRHRRPFDAATWKVKDPSPADPRWPPRLCMVDDLLATRRLDGLDEAGAIDLLGPADHRMTLPGSQAAYLSYYLGPQRGFLPIDSESLVIELDPDHKIRRYAIHHD